jgi:carbon-monoxide dehydrogenase small subunit
MPDKMISFIVNGEPVSVLTPPDTPLVDILREKLGLTGTKIGCRQGDCGACTVIMNGKAVNSCLIPAGKAEGSEIMTIEGLEGPDKLHPIQQALIDNGAVQCGFCFPGMVLSAKALLDENPEPSRSEIRQAMAGNICRCTGYTKIEDGIADAAIRLQACKAEKGDTTDG